MVCTLAVGLSYKYRCCKRYFLSCRTIVKDAFINVNIIIILIIWRMVSNHLCLFDLFSLFRGNLEKAHFHFYCYFFLSVCWSAEEHRCCLQTSSVLLVCVRRYFTARGPLYSNHRPRLVSPCYERANFKSLQSLAALPPPPLPPAPPSPTIMMKVFWKKEDGGQAGGV